MRISESTALSSKSPRAWERMRARWRVGDLALLERAVAQQVHALAARVPERDWLALLELLEALHAAQPLAAFAVVERLDGLMRRLSVEGLRRWILTGLRLHEGANGQALQRYFDLDSGDAVQALHREASLVDVSSLLPSLGWLAHLLAGESMAVQVRSQTVLHAAAQRPVLEPEHGLFLPDGYTALDGADSCELLRAAVAHAAAHWKHSPRKLPGRGLKPMGHAVVGALEDARAEWLFANELPGVGRWFAQAWPVQAREERRDDFEGLLARLHWALADEAHEDPHAWIVKARTAFSRLRDDGQLKGPNALRQAASVLANDLGQMRLRMNLQTFHVPAAYRDDNSFLWDLGDNANDPPPEIQSDVPVQQTARTPPPQSGEDRDGVEAPLVCAGDPLPFFYPNGTTARSDCAVTGVPYTSVCPRG
ncbi:hypothetical protein [Diaphorobacter aerolatus]|uniref:Uncharacterized protein n=1 Tax=Diaphorobacter aerolatus TaxID=1288495 RepID=A0A7H0GJ27_9BURK|nr:hypothetical protein [Diaphorobacter aerolatus]QNP48293.1 hypothetical protein H9K75_20350 [Diaphorobacter aerolatus]